MPEHSERVLNLPAQYEIPPAWRLTTIGETATLQRGNDLPIDQRHAGNFPVVGSNGVTGHHSDFIAKGPGVLVGRSGSVGRVTWVEGDYWPLNTALWVKDFHGNDPHFVYYLLSNLSLSSVAAGVSVPTLNRNLVHPLRVAIPPLPEQRAIARALRTVQSAKEATEKVIAAAKQLKQTLMKHLFAYGPVPLREADQVAVSETKVGAMPAHWHLVPLNSLVIKKVTDGTHKTPTYIPSGTPFVTAKDVRDGRLDFSECRFIAPHEHQELARRCRPEKGDVLITKVGTVGSVAAVDVDFEFSIFVQLALVKPDRARIRSRFLKAVLESTGVQNEIVRTTSQSTMKYIGVGTIGKLPIPLAPAGEQDRCISLLSATEQKITAEVSRANALGTLFGTLLHHLMTGKLRVRDLPQPEPAGSH